MTAWYVFPGRKVDGPYKSSPKRNTCCVWTTKNYSAVVSVRHFGGEVCVAVLWWGTRLLRCRFLCFGLTDQDVRLRYCCCMTSNLRSIMRMLFYLWPETQHMLYLGHENLLYNCKLALSQRRSRCCSSSKKCRAIIIHFHVVLMNYNVFPR